ncbi:MAG: hypothetical protein Q9218_007500, partial [Villophora microphyllina]
MAASQDQSSFDDDSALEEHFFHDALYPRSPPLQVAAESPKLTASFEPPEESEHHPQRAMTYNGTNVVSTTAGSGIVSLEQQQQRLSNIDATDDLCDIDYELRQNELKLRQNELRRKELQLLKRRRDILSKRSLTQNNQLSEHSGWEQNQQLSATSDRNASKVGDMGSLGSGISSVSTASERK